MHRNTLITETIIRRFCSKFHLVREGEYFSFSGMAQMCIRVFESLVLRMIWQYWHWEYGGMLALGYQLHLKAWHISHKTPVTVEVCLGRRHKWGWHGNTSTSSAKKMPETLFGLRISQWILFIKLITLNENKLGIITGALVNDYLHSCPALF